MKDKTDPWNEQDDIGSDYHPDISGLDPDYYQQWHEEIDAFASLRTLSGLFQEAVRNSYEMFLNQKLSSQFSPVDMILESAVDLFLLLGEMIQQGTKYANKNPEIIFKEDNDRLASDPRARIPIDDYKREDKRAGLHTLKSIKIPFPNPVFEDPNAKEIFWRLAESLISIKKFRKIRESFHDFSEFLGFTSNRSQSPKKTTSNYYWWRRQQRRFRRRVARNLKP